MYSILSYFEASICSLLYIIQKPINHIKKYNIVLKKEWDFTTLFVFSLII
jgi:hypothetical protein